MISIKHQDLGKFAKEHFESVKEFFERTRVSIVYPEDFKYIDRWITTNLGKEWNFEKVIKAIPSDLEKLALKIRSIKKKLPKKYKTKIKKVYQSFASSEGNFKIANEKYNGFILLEKLKITVCPYCNRNFIYNTDKHRTSELDHFFNKDTYAILGLSFFNLVPSCKVCNKIKLASNKLVINPYDSRINFNDFVKFKLKIQDVSFYYQASSFEILWNHKNTPKDYEERIKHHIELFQLETLYNHHKDFVIDLIQKQIIYNESYIDSLFQQYEGTLFKNREDVLKLISNNYITNEDLDKRPLSKLTKDIFEELGLI